VDDTPINTNPFNFTTYPAEDSSSEFNVAWGGGAGYTPEHEYMWNTLDKQNLTAFLGLGDNVYIDTPEIPETQKYCYYRRQSRSEYRNFTSNVPMYAIWDDHDFGDNDCTSSTSLDEPEWKMDVLEVFKENFVNPSYGVNETNPGVFHKFSIGDVDFFMLDCRFYRQNPKKFDSPTMLGSGQKHWLKDALNQSDATFKIVASSVPWAEGTKPGSLDTWDGFPEEREEIFSFIEDEKIEGVLLLSADRHRSDAWKIERDDGYTLYDFMSSRLTNIHTHGLIDDEDMLFGYNEKCSFGLLSFNTQISDPTINYQVVNIDNVPIEGCNKTVKLSDLSYPIS